MLSGQAPELAMSLIPTTSEPHLPLLVRRAPSRELSGFVIRMVGYQENGWRLAEAVEIASLVVPLVISFGAPFSIALGRKPAAGDDHASFAAGLYAGHVVMNSGGNCASVQIDFTPLGAYRFFGLPMRELSSRMVSLDDLADREIAELRHKLEDTQDWNARLDLTETFALDRLRRGPQLSRAVVSAYRELAFCHGDVRIAAIAARLGWSRKHLSHRFQDEIGLTPKALARMLRFNHALDLANRTAVPDWAGLAAECGYADQAHLTREFAEFAGATPARFQARAA
jgi:AraC-like DNA-binding protein